MTIRKLRGSLVAKMRLEEAILGGPLTFGAAIESLRTRDDISQTALAKKLKVSKQYVCDVEKGRRQVSTEQAARFAKAFGHPPSVLVQLAIQDDLRASGLNLKISVEEAA